MQILENFSKQQDNVTKYEKDISKVMGLIKQEFLDADSLYIRSHTAAIERGEPQELLIPDEVESGEAFIEERLNSPFNDENLASYLQTLMKDRDEFNIAEWDLNSSQELILAIKSTINGFNPRSFYKVELDNEKDIENGNYIVPDTTFIRRKKA